MNYEHYPQKDGPGCAIGCALMIGLICGGIILIGACAAVLGVLAKQDLTTLTVIACIVLGAIVAIRFILDWMGEYTNQEPEPMDGEGK